MRAFLLGLAVCAVALVAIPAFAQVDVDFGARVPIGDDGQLFVNISSRYFGQPPEVVQTAIRRAPDPDDAAVAMFIARHARRSPDEIFALRAQGLPWFDIGVRFGVPADVWFVPVTVDPGPPYGHAYGYWRKHRRDPRVRIVLSDREARDLVAVRVVHEYYGVPVERAMAWRASGRDVRVLLAERYRERHGKGHGPKDDRPGHGHDRDKDHDRDGDNDRGEGHDRGHGHGKDHK